MGGGGMLPWKTHKVEKRTYSCTERSGSGAGQVWSPAESGGRGGGGGGTPSQASAPPLRAGAPMPLCLGGGFGTWCCVPQISNQSAQDWLSPASSACSPSMICDKTLPEAQRTQGIESIT